MSGTPKTPLFTRLTPAIRLLALIYFVAIVWFRIPGIMHGGRFWAEEGTIYFARAWSLPWHKALFLPANGYLSLAANLAGVIACHLARIRDAPHVTMAIAFVIQTLPALLLVFAADSWLQSPAVLFSALSLLGLQPVSDEVWLNTANSQFHLELAAALCLVLATPAGIWGALRGFLVFLIPLCSPGSISLVPLFIWRAGMEWQKARIVEAICFIGGSALQILVFYTPIPGRGALLGPTTLALIFSVKHLANPFLGEQAANMIADGIHRDLMIGNYPLAGVLSTAVAAGLLMTAVIARRRAEPVFLLLSGVLLAVLSYDEALGGGSGLITPVGGNRYAFAPAVLFGLTMLCLAATARNWDRIAKASSFVVVWLVAIAVQQTILPQDAGFIDGPSWKTELAAWRADSNHPLAIWPRGWVMKLPPR